MEKTYLATCLLVLPFALNNSFGAQGNNEITVSGYSDIITFDKPVAYYRFEETTGDKTKNFGTGGTANDGLWKVGTGPDDSVAGTASVEAGPRPPDFKGFDAANNGGKFLGPDATIWVDAQGQLLNNLASFSLEYWVRPANRVTDPDVFGTRIGIVGQNDAVEYGFINPTTIQIWTPGGGALDTTYSFPDNEWHHVATIATGNDIRNYFDGKLVGTGGSATGNYGSAAFNVHIGGGGVYDGTGNFFTGDIDEVAIFDKAIPAERIVQHFKAGKEGAFSVPFIGKPSGTITGFTIEVNDFAPIIADTNTIVLSLNGTAITPTSVTQAGTVTTVKYAPASPFPSQSSQNTSMSIKDKNGVTYSDEGSFTVPAYGTIPPDLKVTPDTSKPGFSVFTYAVENNFADNLATAERVIAGELKDADGNVFPNLADLSAATENGRFAITDTINFDDAAADTHGNFQNDPAVRVPGVADADNYVQEIIAFVELPAGIVTMGVNSDDAFKTTVGSAGDVFASGSPLGIFDAGRAASDTIFVFNVQEAGVYPFRLLWSEFGGDSSVEWFTVNGGQKVLINGSTAGAFKSYRAQAAGTPKAIVRKVTPTIGSGGVANDVTISAEIVDGGTAISGASLKLDGATVNATVTKAGNVTTVSYKNTTTFAEASTHTATVAYTDGTTPVTRDWKFTAPNNYLIAWWDFNDASDPTKAIDKVAGTVGVMAAGAKFTDDAKGHTGKAGDRAAKIGSADPVVSGSVDVDAANAAVLNAGGIQNQLAVAYWQRLDEVRNSSAFWTTGAGQDRAFQAHSPWSDNTVYFDTGGGCCDGTQRISSNLNDNLPEAGGDAATYLSAWHHFLFQKNGDNKQVWIDGKLFFEGVNSSPLPFVFNRLTIGAINSGSDSTHGDIDDFAVFASVLTPAEIDKLAKGTAPDQVRTPTPKGPGGGGGGAKFTVETLTGGKFHIEWTGTATLQKADSVTGPWTDVTGATSPRDIDPTGASAFYRLKQ